MENQDTLIGKVATCSHEHIAVIAATKVDAKKRTIYIGKRIIDGKPWQSMKPKILGNSLEEYNASIKALENAILGLNEAKEVETDLPTLEN